MRACLLLLSHMVLVHALQQTAGAPRLRCPPPPSMRICSPLLASAEPPTPSRLLLVGDAGVLLLYTLTLSSLRAFAMAFDEATTEGFSLEADLLGMDLHMTTQFISIELASAISIVVAWLVGASIAGACDQARV